MTHAEAVPESLHPSPQTGRGGGDTLCNLLGFHWSCCIAENDIEMLTLLPPSPECWADSCVPPCLDKHFA